jgi:hypothetical protein
MKDAIFALWANSPPAIILNNMKKQIFFSIGLTVLCITTLNAQMTVENVNHLLDKHPYFNLALEYDSNITLPDSIQIKMINSLKRVLPQQYADSVFSLSETVLKNIEEYALRECKNDTVCFEKIYAERYDMNIQNKKVYYYNQCYSRSLILACGNWNVQEAISYLKEELENEKCENRRITIEMVLAKLDDYYKQILMERYTLSHVLKNSQLDTINDKDRIYEHNSDDLWKVSEGIEVAIYLKSKEMLLNILDLIYIRGISQFCIGHDCSDIPYVSLFVDYFHFNNYNVFHKYPNYEKFHNICDSYGSTVWRLYDRRRNRMEQKKLDILLSTEYRTKIKEQLREWIIENVNFE